MLVWGKGPQEGTRTLREGCQEMVRALTEVALRILSTEGWVRREGRSHRRVSNKRMLRSFIRRASREVSQERTGILRNDSEPERRVPREV